MSYRVLARKWRPASFAEVVGQTHVLKVLENALTLGRVHHAYLFSGTRGVGKTSIARLLAKGLNCETGITATPCGVCDNCRDIELGRFVDLIEIDAASRTKVEDTREILDNIQYLPTRGRYKVYLIDEVHMLSRSSFNALLKTLEEPPEHVKFLLATTDPQKLPVTILSRCLHLHLKALEKGQIEQQLSHILTQEQIASEPKAISLLAKAAQGSMRDALSLTDQAIALGNGALDSVSIGSMLGVLDQAIPLMLVDALSQGEGALLMAQIEQAARQGADWDSLLSETIGLLHQIALLQLLPGALGDYTDFEDKLRFLAKNISANDIQLYYQILLMARKDLPFAPDKKGGVEMAFLRALAFQPKTNTPTEGLKQTSAPQIDKPSVSAPTLSAPPTARLKTALNAAPLTREKRPSADLLPPQSGLPSESDPTASITARLLAERDQLMQGEAPEKKSDRAQPESSAHTDEQRVNVKQAPLHEKSTGSLMAKAKALATHAEASAAQNKTATAPLTADTYQWQAQSVPERAANRSQSLTLKEVKLAVTHEKTAQLTKKLIAEVALQDSWSAEIETLETAPLIKQLAVNAFKVEAEPNQIELHLRSSAGHLNNNSANLQRLQQALTKQRNCEVQLTVVIDDDRQQLTPLERREALYQEKLAQAKQDINQDDKIAMICQLFEARIDEESIRPV